MKLTTVRNGLDNLLNDKKYQELIKGNIAYLCHSASVTFDFKHGLSELQKVFGKRIVKVFGPQHGFVTDVQDNMIETQNFVHPYFNIPILSLYGETRVPTQKMLEGVDTLIVDLQDVGTRVYTYITTLSYIIESLEKTSIRLVVLDRPNPVGGKIIEGAILEPDWKSFVGHLPIPMRHALTMAEVAKFHIKLNQSNVDFHYVPVTNWKRESFWQDSTHSWVNPSPNLATPDSAITFCGTVLFEGTNISEGRGTTRSLEIVGAPNIEPFSFCEKMENDLKNWSIKGFKLRPLMFLPMFQKHAGKSCGGIQIHVTKPDKFESWKLGQYLIKAFYHQKDFQFEWNSKPYEYQFENLAMDYINGNSTLRQWVENNGSEKELDQIVEVGMDQYLNHREDILIYN